MGIKIQTCDYLCACDMQAGKPPGSASFAAGFLGMHEENDLRENFHGLLSRAETGVCWPPAFQAGFPEHYRLLRLSVDKSREGRRTAPLAEYCE